MLTVTVKHSDNEVVLQCRGAIAGGDEAAILCAAVGQQTPSVTLDLTEVDTIDSAGIGSLIALQAAGIYLKLVNPGEQVCEVLRTTHADSILDICEFEASKL